MKPLPSIARARRVRNGLSSSTMSSERSLPRMSPSGAVSSLIRLIFPVCSSSLGEFSPISSFLRSIGRLCRIRRGQEGLTRPGHLDQCALAGLPRIAETHGRAGAFQQGLGDEQAKAKAAASFAGAPLRHIGLTDAVDDFSRESGTVVD